MTDDIIQWLSAVAAVDSPYCLPAGSAARAGAPQPRPATRSAPVWAGTVWGWWWSSGSIGSGVGDATPWSSPSGSSRSCGEWDFMWTVIVVKKSAWQSGSSSYYSPVLKLHCSCFVCASIHQLLWLKAEEAEAWMTSSDQISDETKRRSRPLTCTLDSPGWEKDREKKGFHRLVFVVSNTILIGEVYCWMFNHTWINHTTLMTTNNTRLSRRVTQH